MNRERDLTEQDVLVLKAMLTDSSWGWWGSRIARATGMKPGTVYPVLLRMERLSLLTSRWEGGGNLLPRRRLYELTVKGRELAEALNSEPALARD